MNGIAVLYPTSRRNRYATLDLTSKRVEWHSVPMEQADKILPKDGTAFDLYDGLINQDRDNLLALFYWKGEKYLFWGDDFILVDHKIKAQWVKSFLFRTLTIFRDGEIIYRNKYRRELLLASMILIPSMAASWDEVDHASMQYLVYCQINSPEVRSDSIALYGETEDLRKRRQAEVLGVTQPKLS